MQDRDVHQFVGMKSDTLNIRFTDTIGDGTQLTIVTEQGPGEIKLYDSLNPNNLYTLQGEYRGHCAVGDYLVLFSNSNIYRIDLSQDKATVKTLYSGDLNLGNDRVETIGIYENALIQKVYWLGGDNPPRVMNIITDTTETDINKFNFVQNLQLNEEVYVSRLSAQEGIFAPGVIQYAITYYNKYLQETNIAYTTPLFSITHSDRGGNPEDKISVAFKVTIKNPDENFEYIRCYAIHRTSINAVPTVRRLVDTKNIPKTIGENNETDKFIYFIDNGTEGETVDPSFLLYVGGEDIIAHTFTHKDGTLFFGDIQIRREEPNIQLVVENTEAHDAYRIISPYKITRGAYDDFLWSKSVKPNTDHLVNTAHFFPRETYRLGYQLQHKSGRWSAPIPLRTAQGKPLDREIRNTICEGEQGEIKIPTLKITLDFGISDPMHQGYVKARPVVVIPQLNERNIVMQGIVCPTLINGDTESNHAPDVQASWFLRPYTSYTSIDNVLEFENTHMGIAEYRDFAVLKDYVDFLPNDDTSWSASEFSIEFRNSLRNIEVWGLFRGDRYKKFRVTHDTLTLHSPDVEFEEDAPNLDLSNCSAHIIGLVQFDKSYGVNLLQTSTPGISSNYQIIDINDYLSGNLAAGTLISPFCFYDDIVTKNDDDQIIPGGRSVAWQAFAWHRSGSINNDFNRGSYGGTRSALLSKKILSNLKVAKTFNVTENESENLNDEGMYDTLYTTDIQLFNSDQVSQLRLKTETKGAEGEPNVISYKNYQGNIDYAIASSESFNGVYRYQDSETLNYYAKIKHYGITNSTNSIIKELTRIKYKSTPHLVLQTNVKAISQADRVPPEHRQEYSGVPEVVDLPYLHLVEIRRNVTEKFGGDSDEAILANRWVPAGEPTKITAGGEGESETVTIEFKYGDAWYQRYDCLKTYPFTQEDPNSVVDIVSFCCESRVNLEGRYDRNKGLVNNVAMSPKNFNLLNQVYSNLDNFFTYRTFDEDYYKLSIFHNSVTWSRQKTDAQTVDPWTNINMAATLNLDGNKGKIIALRTFNDTIVCFQERAVSVIKFNERVQIPTSDSNPIEISNNYKVDGYRIINDHIGTLHRTSVAVGESGIFFTGDRDGSLYQVKFTNNAPSVEDIAVSKGMYNWYRPDGGQVQYNFYDFKHRDLYSSYMSGDDFVLNYSDILQAFSSQLNYEKAKDFFTFKDSSYTITDDNSIKLWKMFAGLPCTFFGEPRRQYIQFISNDKMLLDKTYNNVEYRAELYNGADEECDKSFDYIRVENEYQDSGDVDLEFSKYLPSNLKRKFRVWRASMPRDNNDKKFIADRIRGPWVKIKLGLKSESADKKKMHLHNAVVNYMY